MYTVVLKLKDGSKIGISDYDPFLVDVAICHGDRFFLVFMREEDAREAAQLAKEEFLSVVEADVVRIKIEYCAENKR